MPEGFWWRAAAVFCLELALSTLWALYFHYAKAKRALAAANADLLLIGTTIALTLAYVKDWRMIPIQLVAGWLGTYLTIKSGRLAA